MDTSTIVITLGTAALAIYTALLYFEASKSRKIQESPDICVNIEPLLDGLYIFIHNQGKGSATNIKIEATPNLKIYRKDNIENINDLSIMTLSFLRPGQFFITDIGKYTWLLNENETKNIKFDIEYSSMKKIEWFRRAYKKFSETIIVDINAMGDGLYSAKNTDTLLHATSLPIHIIPLPKTKI